MVTEMSVWGNVRSGNVLVGKCSLGEVSVGEVSSRGIVCLEKCPSGKCQSAKCPVGEMSVHHERCFKWAAIAALYHEDIKYHPKRIGLLQHYEDQYDWNGLEIPPGIEKIGTFKRNNPETVVNVLFNKKERIYTARRSELNGKCSKQVSLLMIVDGENRH